ncbi:AsmA family protein [Candidatus Parabeggiatoa sp. HSG14]|uniref:AsmA family protein n=1 Tax=Candidatus Parabeggiatoa sp. HSG14 TaxID=3055593 RepID=UPI0025A866BC|nr:AsmA family protein [Thiotrichales bacterium HSG14]
MKRFFKFLFSLLGVVITLIVIAIFVIVFVVDPNDYKDKITDLVEEKTGRALTIDGNINLTFFPWLGLDLGKVNFGNASNFEESEFSKVNQAQIRVKFLPLLKKHVEIDTVLLNGMVLNLTRKPNGQTNWDDLVALGENSEKPEKPSKEETKGSKTIKTLKIEGLDIRNAKIVWDDQQLGNRYVFFGTHLKTTAISLAFNEPIQFQLSTALEMSGNHTFTGQIDLSSQLAPNLDTQRYRLEPLTLNATVQGDVIPGGKQTVSINTHIDLDLHQQTLRLNKLMADIMGASLSGEVQAIDFQMNPRLSGKFKLADLNLQKVLKQLGLSSTLPSEQILKTVGLETQFEASLTEANFNNLHFIVDDNQLKTPELNIDLEKQTLHAKAISLQAYGVNLNSKLNIQQLFSQPIIGGKLALAPFNPRKVFKRLEQVQLISALPLPDDKLLPLKRAALKTQFQFTEANGIRLNNLNLSLDDNQFNTPQLIFDFNKEMLNLDKLSLQAFGINLNGEKVAVKQILSKPKVTAKLTLAPFNPQKVLKRLGQPPLEVPAPFTLTRAALKTYLTLTPEKIALSGLRLTIDKHNTFNSKYVTFNFAKDTLALSKFVIKALGLTLNGKLSVKNVSTQAALQGSLKLSPFNPRRLLQRLKQPVPKTTDLKVLNTLALDTQFRGSLSHLNLKNVKIRLDDSQLKGYLSVKNFTQPAIAFNLNVNNIDIDRYLAPKKPEDSQSDSPLSGEEILLPIKVLRALNLNGTLKIGQLKVSNLKIKDINLDVSAKQGKIKLTPKAALYQGTYQGNVMVDAKSEPPLINIDNTLNSVQASPLLIDLLGDDKISGTTNLKIQLTAKASTLQTLLNTLDGPIFFQFLDGALKGFNIGHSIRKTKAWLKGEPMPGEEPMQTDFASLQGTLVAQNGFLYNNDLELKSPLLRANGRGNIAINSQDIHFFLQTAFVDTTKGQGGKTLGKLKRFIIPVKITGKLNTPTIQPDVEAIKAIFLQRAKAKAAAKLEEEKQKFLEKQQDKLNDSLKDIFKGFNFEDFVK